MHLIRSLKKSRYGDRDVQITIPNLTDTDKTPVLVDDIISTGITFLTVTKQLLAKNYKPPICIGVHALFNSEAKKLLLDVGVKEIISCNTILHESNQIDLTELISASILAELRK